MDSSKSLCRRLGLRDRPQQGSNYEERPRRRVRQTGRLPSNTGDRLTSSNFRQGSGPQPPVFRSKSDASPSKPDPRFATEPPDASARDRMDSSMTEEASAASSGRHLKTDAAMDEGEEEAPAQMADRVAFTLEEEAPEPELDAEAQDERNADLEEPEDKPPPLKRCFSHAQMQEMIKNHAFSSGLSSYKQLRSVRSQVREQSSFSVNEKEIEAQ